MDSVAFTIFSPSLELVLLVIAIVSNGLLAYAVYSSNRKSATNIIFALLSIVTSLWLLNNFVTNHVVESTQYAELALLASRFGIFFAAPMSALFFLLAHTIPADTIRLRKGTYYAVLLATVVMMALNLSPLAFTGIAFDDGGVQPTPGPGLAPFAILSTLFSVLAVYVLARKYVKASGVLRKQLSFVLFGILAMLGLIIVTVLIPIILFSSLVFLPLTPLYTLAFLGATAYSITTYQLFNIKILVTQALTFVMSVVLFAKIFTESTVDAAIVGVLIFTFMIVFGYFLVRSVKQEVRQRELIEKQERELEEINKQQENLLHFISHEIKGYLTKSEAAFAAICAGDFGPVTPQLHEMSGTALADVRKGVDTVIDILDASNLKRGTVSYAADEFDLVKTIDEIVRDLRPAAEGRGLELVYERPVTGAYMIVGDEDKLRRHVIRNLIDNSIKYTLKGFVRIELSRNDTVVRMTVSDTGVGITPEDMKRLFTEGGKGAESLKVNVHSTGYGLFIAKTIVEGHGGRVWAESEGKDKGSRFVVELPLSQGE